MYQIEWATIEEANEARDQLQERYPRATLVIVDPEAP